MPTEAELVAEAAAIIEAARTHEETRAVSKDAAAAVAEARSALERLTAAVAEVDVAKAGRLDLGRLAAVLNEQATIVRAALNSST